MLTIPEPTQAKGSPPMAGLGQGREKTEAKDNRLIDELSGLYSALLWVTFLKQTRK